MRKVANATFRNTSHEQKEYGDPEAKLSIVHVTREFSGAVVGTSTAVLLACAPAPDTFSYVGTDHFRGTVDGRTGSFAFQHGGSHEHGKLLPFGYIVAGSGRDQLGGISGTATISVNEAGEHTIELEYDFA